MKSNKEENNGGSTSYYRLPENASELQDLIEHTNMSWNYANIFKACYRAGKQEHSNELRDINKILWFAQRQKDLILESQTENSSKKI